MNEGEGIRKTCKFRQVLIDVHTQYDLMFRGAYDRDTVLRSVRRLIAWSHVHCIPIISLALMRRPGTIGENICVRGTSGQRKVRGTVLASHATLDSGPSTDLPGDLLRKCQQVILNVSTQDPFVQPRADRLLTGLNANQIAIFGIGFNGAIKCTALGLLARGKNVAIMTDAIDLNSKSPECVFTLRKLQAKGATLMETASLIGRNDPGGQTREERVQSRIQATPNMRRITPPATPHRPRV